MTEQQQQPSNEPEQVETEGAETGTGEPEGNANEPDTFDREYVQKLRSEAAESRTKLKEVSERGDQFFEMLKLRTMEQATRDILQSPDDMPLDDPRFYDENGFPNPDGMREVAQELIERKPYLARVHGDAHQGYKPESKQPEDGSAVLGNAIRGLI